MTTELSIFAARLREHIGFWSEELPSSSEFISVNPDQHDIEFNALALMLFELQFKQNESYRKLCNFRGVSPGDVNQWSQIPAVPTAAFKDFEMTSLSPAERARVFHSSGTTAQRPSRHFHSAESLELYEASLWPWMAFNCGSNIADRRLVSLTPPAYQVPHSSLVHMFDHAAKKMDAKRAVFVGGVSSDGSWTIDFDAAIRAMTSDGSTPLLVVGTAFSFVHLLDELISRDIRLELPPSAMVLETGGYKGRSRSMPKSELHTLIIERLGVSPANILCEYGMSELSSQAYQTRDGSNVFRFPPWARARVVSPETGREVGEGETGLLSIVDLANVFSVMAIQTEDIATKRGAGFELLGRATLAEPRGCSLASA